MTTVFADAAFYIALTNPRDQLKAMAGAFADAYNGRMVTTEYVLLEVGNFLSRYKNRRLFVNLIESLEADSETEVVPSSHRSWQRGLELYSCRADKDWSLTDCISFEIMREQGISDALTGDHHFEQAGFTILLK